LARHRLPLNRCAEPSLHGATRATQERHDALNEFRSRNDKLARTTARGHAVHRMGDVAFVVVKPKCDASIDSRLGTHYKHLATRGELHLWARSPP